MKKLMIVLSVGGLLWMLASCSNNGGGPTVKTPDQLVADGWQAYKQKNYQSALNSFTQAIQARTTYMDAYNGAGWSDAKLSQMTDAYDQFTLGFNIDTTNQALRKQFEAGFALIYNTQKNYPTSVFWAGQVLQGDSNWIFTRDLSLSAADLYILLAEDYFAMAKFDSSLYEVQMVDTRDSVSFTPNISNDLGRIQLADEIERLRSTH
jgi:tetratricopeptide (TPR) repeat protein